MIVLQKVIPQPLMETGLNAASQVFDTEGVFSFDKKYLVTAPSGKGKSTLIHLIYGLRQDYVGDIFIEQKDIKTFDVDTWANIRQKKLAIVFQDLRLFLNLTARENIELKKGLTTEGRQFDIETAAKRLCIFAFLDKKCETLSYGQRQRVAILRGIAQPFDMILLDEPFSHLDAENIKIASDLIQETCDRNKAGLIHVSLGDEYYFDYDKKLSL
ncbi:MAG: ATP-binding cassette domain-containing protein [Saprospiraceae bacterium]|nr:ATP-binding cassette domain-containing protein [Saprospiraceae bacterium]